MIVLRSHRNFERFSSSLREQNQKQIHIAYKKDGQTENAILIEESSFFSPHNVDSLRKKLLKIRFQRN